MAGIGRRWFREMIADLASRLTVDRCEVPTRVEDDPILRREALRGRDPLDIQNEDYWQRLSEWEEKRRGG